MEIFFLLDAKIKWELYNGVHDENFIERDDDGIKYGDKLFRLANECEKDFIRIAKCLNIDFTLIHDFFETIRIEIINSNYKMDVLKDIYRRRFYDMSDKLIDEVKSTCIGYVMFRGITGLINKCNSVNEMLHVFHSYIVNNEYFYESMPKLKSKANTNGYDIVLYGAPKEEADGLYNGFPLDLDCGDTDILSLSKTNKILVMVRDRGHALTLEIDIEKDKVWVKYFIPKICNVNMVNKLKGVRKVDGNSKSTTGEFCVSKSQFVSEVIDLIGGVPMDTDMEIISKYNKTL